MTTNLPRYVQTVVKNNAVLWRYNPPADAVAAGAVKRCLLPSNQASAFAAAEQYNTVLDHWRKEQRYLATLTGEARVLDLIKAYKATPSYAKLSRQTAKDYLYYLEQWHHTTVSGTALLHTKLNNLTAPLCQRLYDKHAEHSISFANHSLSVYKLLFNFAIRLGYITFNPFAKVLRRKEKPRRVVWDKEHLKAFMDVAFSSFETRSIGLIAYMAYAYAQRLGDMRNLKWSQYDSDTGVLALEQSKRRARVAIPTPMGLRSMLEQQKSEYGWQDYIAPTAKKDMRGGLKPFTLNNLGRAAKQIMVEAKLPPELQLMDMRRTAVTEMIDAGVPLPNIMAMSGHSTPQSLVPYMKNTLKSATVAQDMRDSFIFIGAHA
jgi:integrase